MRIYLDVCCLNRPFDDLSQERVQFESDAVLSVAAHCQAGYWQLVTSEIIDLELNKLTNINKLRKVRKLCSISSERLLLTDAAVKRAAEFQRNGIKVYDSLHLAVAELGLVDVFLTTDDRFLKAAQQLDLTITVQNPLIWLMEELRNE